MTQITTLGVTPPAASADIGNPITGAAPGATRARVLLVGDASMGAILAAALGELADVTVVDELPPSAPVRLGLRGREDFDAPLPRIYPAGGRPRRIGPSPAELLQQRQRDRRAKANR